MFGSDIIRIKVKGYLRNITDNELFEFEERGINNNDKKYYATELFSWLYDKNKRITSFDETTNLKKETRDKLKNDFTISNIEVVTVEKAKDVRKYLFKLNDNEHIEAVLMNHDYGNSLCISSQVGCNMGCKFCESGRRKKVRNLTVGEMVEQILKVEDNSNLRISHVVIMGIGEPFDNYDNICKFIKIINYNFYIIIPPKNILSAIIAHRYAASTPYAILSFFLYLSGFIFVRPSEP